MICRYFSPWNGTQTEAIVEKKKERKKGKESECLTDCEQSQGNICTSFRIVRRERISRGGEKIDSSRSE